jgi:hypothetical protein
MADMDIGDGEPPDRLVVRLDEGTEYLWRALRDGAVDDGVTASDRIRALVDLWSKDADAVDAPAWLTEFKELVRRGGEELGVQARKAAVVKRRTALQRRRRARAGETGEEAAA